MGYLQGAVARAARASAVQAVDVYVPRRVHVAGLEEVPPGAGIVGTPRTGEMVAVDYISGGYLPPGLSTWQAWVELAAEEHHEPDRATEPLLVSELLLVRVGWCRHGRVAVEEDQRDAVWRWIEAGQYR